MSIDFNYKAKLSIEFFPSRTELLYILDKFMEKTKYLNDYFIENKDKVIHILFKATNIANEFMQCLLNEQSKNALYNKTTFSLSLINNNSEITQVNTSAIERLYKGFTPYHPVRDKIRAKQLIRKSLPYVTLFNYNRKSEHTDV